MATKNGQSREIGDIGYTRHKTKTNKAKNTTQCVDTTIHKTLDKDKKTIKKKKKKHTHTTPCVQQHMNFIQK